VLVSPLRILPETAENHFLEVAMNVRDDGAGRRGLRADHGTERFGRGRPRERARSRYHLVEHRAEAEDVAPRVYLAAGGLLRRHVSRGPGDAARRTQGHVRRNRDGPVLRHHLAVHQLREAEVEHLDGAIGADHDVGGLKIAMDDAARVCSGQCVGDRNRDP